MSYARRSKELTRFRFLWNETKLDYPTDASMRFF